MLSLAIPRQAMLFSGCAKPSDIQTDHASFGATQTVRANPGDTQTDRATGELCPLNLTLLQIGTFFRYAPMFIYFPRTVRKYSIDQRLKDSKLN